MSQSDAQQALKFAGLMGHPFVVLRPNAKHGQPDNRDGRWLVGAECGTLQAARNFAAEQAGSMIYGKTKPLPKGGKGWERYTKRRSRQQ